MTLVIHDLHDRPHIRLLSQLLVTKSAMKAAWYNEAYDGDAKDLDREKWYIAMDKLVADDYVEKMGQTYGTAVPWYYYNITLKGETLLVEIMEMDE